MWKSLVRNAAVILMGFIVTGCAGCNGITIGSRPTRADIDLCRANLSEPQGATLQILWEEFDEVLTDGVHNGDTCPILVLGPLQAQHTSGAITDAEFATRLYKFYVAKYKQNLNGHQAIAAKRLADAGLPPISGGSPPVVDKSCPVLVDGQPCGKPSTFTGMDDTLRHFKCSAGHEWTLPRKATK